MGNGCSRFHTLPAVFHFVSAAARSRRLENELEKTKEDSINEIKLLLLVSFSNQLKQGNNSNTEVQSFPSPVDCIF
jgi:hypothetical protein